jgi:hypothetical protein
MMTGIGGRFMIRMAWVGIPLPIYIHPHATRAAEKK